MANAYVDANTAKQGLRQARIRQHAQHAYDAMLLLLEDYRRDCPDAVNSSIPYALMVQELVEGEQQQKKKGEAV